MTRWLWRVGVCVAVPIFLAQAIVACGLLTGVVTVDVLEDR